jgi:hypothetical protein
MRLRRLVDYPYVLVRLRCEFSVGAILGVNVKSALVPGLDTAMGADAAR